MITIRDATANDAEAIFAIWDARPHAKKTEHLPTRERLVGEFQERLAAQGGPFRYFIAQNAADTIIGFVCTQPTRNNPALRETMAEMSCYVIAGERGAGTGAHLVAHLQTHVARTSLEWLVAYVSASNASMLRVLEKLRWRSIGHFPAPSKNTARGSVLLFGWQAPAGADASDL